MDAATKELAADLLYACYRNRRDNGATAWKLADEFGGVVVLEIRYQVAIAGEAAQAREEAEPEDVWALAYQMAPQERE